MRGGAQRGSNMAVAMHMHMHMHMHVLIYMCHISTVALHLRDPAHLGLHSQQLALRLAHKDEGRMLPGCARARHGIR